MPRPRKKTKRRAKNTGFELEQSTRSAISGIVQIGAGVLFILVLQDKAGIAGNSVRKFLTFFFGSYGMIFPAFLILSGVFHWIIPTKKIEAKRSIGLLLCVLAFLGLMHI